MASDYKRVKEAFVADNTGTSIWTVNAVSLAGLSSYALAHSLARFRGRTDGVTDYIVSFLPLLLGQTAAASRPVAFNAVLLAVAGVLWLLSERIAEDKREADGRVKRPADGLDDSSDEDAPPTAAKAVAVPTKPVRTRESGQSLRLRIPQHNQDGRAGDGRTSPLPDLPMTGDVERPLSAGSGSESASVISRALGAVDGASSASGHKRMPSSTAIDIPASPSPSTTSYARLPSSVHPRAAPTPARASTVPARFPPQPFLAVYRAHMMVMTAIAILAVDFPIFPREFGKCEDWGTSLMDIGVGSFVFSQGIVSALPHLLPRSGQTRSFPAEVYGALRRCLPVLLLGGIRVLMVKGVEYPEHVTEYGVHWNFFFTLGLMPLCGVFAARLRRVARYVVLALMLSGAHQGALATGLQSWVMGPSRNGLLDMNKEGIVSFSGYFAIFLLGLDLGHYLLPPDPYYFERVNQRQLERHTSVAPRSSAIPGTMRRKPGKLALVLASYATLWWALLWAMRESGMQVSRRLANMPYVIWITAFNSTFLLGYLAIELAVPVPASVKATPLLDAINANGLLIFLAANLLTGLVNVSMQTMFAADRTAMLVLIGYSATLSALAWSLRRRKLRL